LNIESLYRSDFRRSAAKKPPSGSHLTQSASRRVCSLDALKKLPRQPCDSTLEFQPEQPRAQLGGAQAGACGQRIEGDRIEAECRQQR